ncbi:hypothetical protein FSP39_013487 [Pinctada imbricata]|uniref:Uncharacterized protein n=1 Tax=Pinctada imbricata TaxID=66713 RepID=A0AA88Y737_PINIB|nr:hypothetical protein FSP39_013487 [Pinctada imbricata]
MATSSDKSSEIDLTICSICFETFKTPKHFSCLHSFCEGCIKTYIKTTFVQTRGGVNCPVCRMYVIKPEDVSIEEWSSKLPTNHILVSLIDMNESKSGKKMCAACARENESERASSWCINCGESLCKLCERYHRKNKVSSMHKLVDIESSELTEPQIHNADMLCTDHPDKKVEAFCSDHSVVCCMTCALLKHRKCDNFGSVDDAAKQKKTSKGIQNFQKDLNRAKKSLEEMMHHRTENLQSFSKDIQDIRLEVETLFLHLSSHLGQLRSDMMSEITRLETSIQTEIENEREEMLCKISTIDNDQGLFQTYMKYASSALFLQAMEKLMEEKTILEVYVKDKKGQSREFRVSWKSDEKLSKMQKQVQAFGKLNLRRIRLYDNSSCKEREGILTKGYKEGWSVRSDKPPSMDEKYQMKRKKGESEGKVFKKEMEYHT